MYTLTDEELRRALSDAIELFVEYRDQKGEVKRAAMLLAIQDTVDSLAPVRRSNKPPRTYADYVALYRWQFPWGIGLILLSLVSVAAFWATLGRCMPVAYVSAFLMTPSGFIGLAFFLNALVMWWRAGQTRGKP